MLRWLLALTTVILPVARSYAQDRQPVVTDWAGVRDEAVQLLSEYLRINTTNPPGDELQGALLLKRVLEREGIQVQILDTAELKGRANLYARLRGNGSKKAIALVHHIDVVPADAKYWSVDPFSGIVRNGYVYGRGAIDMKGQAVVHVMAMLALKRSGAPLTRDIVLIANADEELGSTGAQVFTERHADLLRDVEYVITEGGVNSVTGTSLTYYGVGVAEKQAFWHRLTVRGVPSHGSMPTPQNPVPRLVAALNRIARYETPLQPTPAVEKFFRDISRTHDGERRRWLSDVGAALSEPRARDWILSNVQWNAILRNTISLTGLQGSGKTNVIPAEATADLDIRLLPGQDPAAFLATLRRVVGDTAVVWAPLVTPKPPLDNPIDTELYRAIEEAARERDPGAPVTTLMSPGYTDRPLYRRLGIVAYGLDPFRIDSREYQHGLHGNDERLSVENVGFGVRFLYDILRRVQ